MAGTSSSNPVQAAKIPKRFRWTRRIFLAWLLLVGGCRSGTPQAAEPSVHQAGAASVTATPPIPPARSAAALTGQPAAGRGLRFSPPQKSGPLTFRLACSAVSGQIYYVLRITNHSSKAVVVARDADEITGWFTHAHSVDAQGVPVGVGFYGGMKYRWDESVTPAVPALPRYTPDDMVTLSPHDSITQWRRMVPVEDETAIEHMKLHCTEHTGGLLPRPTFAGDVVFTDVPLSDCAEGMDD